MPTERIEELRTVAAKLGEQPSTLMRRWVLERLAERGHEPDLAEVRRTLRAALSTLDHIDGHRTAADPRCPRSRVAGLLVEVVANGPEVAFQAGDLTSAPFVYEVVADHGMRQSYRARWARDVAGMPTPDRSRP